MRWIDVRCATFAVLVLAIILAACGGGSTPSPSPTPTPIPQPVQPPALTGTPDQNADALIAVMTTDEKIQLVHGTGYTGGPQPRGAAGYVPGITHLNIPFILRTEALASETVLDRQQLSHRLSQAQPVGI